MGRQSEGSISMGVVRKRLPGRWEWEGVEPVAYDGPTVKGVSKRVLIGPQDGAEGVAMRYFEVQPGGNTSFEQHPHIHEVYVVRGRGRVLVGESYHDIGEGDVIYIGPNEQHVLQAAPDEVLGFLCVAPKA